MNAWTRAAGLGSILLFSCTAKLSVGPNTTEPARAAKPSQPRASSASKPGHKADWDFAVGSRGRVLASFERSREEAVQRLDFKERAQICRARPEVAPNAIDVHRSLFVHDQATIDPQTFSLQRSATVG